MDNIMEHDKMISVGDRAWHGKDENLESATLQIVHDKVLNFEPVYLPMGLTDPLTGKIVRADHRAVYRVPNSIYDQCVDVIIDPEVPGRFHSTFDVPKMRQLISAAAEAGTLNEQGVIKIAEVGPAYTPLLNRDAIRLLQPIEDSGLVMVETGLTILNGQKVVLLFKIGEYEATPGDTRLMYLAFINAHDSSVSPGFVFTEVRVVCDNTRRQMMDSKCSKRLQVKHTANVVQNFADLAETLDIVRREFRESALKLQALSRVTIRSEEHLRTLIREIYGNTTERKGRLEDKLVELFETAKGNDMIGVKGTGLALHEAFTFYLSHEKGTSKSNPDQRMNDFYFSNDNLKLMTKVEDVLLSAVPSGDNDETWPDSDTVTDEIPSDDDNDLSSAGI